MSSSNLRNGHVSCHHPFGPHVAVINVHVALLNLRKSHVAMSILGVKGHTGPPCIQFMGVVECERSVLGSFR